MTFGAFVLIFAIKIMVLMLEPFQLPFMQRAALEVALLAPLAGLLGAQIVLRRLAFFTHGVGAAAFPGLVIAGPAGIPPALAALGVGGGFAVVQVRLERLGRRAGVATDTATALLLVAALATGIVLSSDVFESGAGVDQLLFGSLLAIGTPELIVSAVALAVVAFAAALFRRAWIAAGSTRTPAPRRASRSRPATSSSSARSRSPRSRRSTRWALCSSAPSS